jgi:hypothetical protein
MVATTVILDLPVVGHDRLGEDPCLDPSREIPDGHEPPAVRKTPLIGLCCASQRARDATIG